MWTPSVAQSERLIAQLDDAGGFTTITLQDLKSLMNVDRLGRVVLADTKRWLNRNGIGYFPREVLDNNDEPRQGQELRLYRTDRASALAKLVTAVLDPSADGDELLAGLLSTSGEQRAEELEERLDRARAAIKDALTEIDRTSAVE